MPTTPPCATLHLQSLQQPFRVVTNTNGRVSMGECPGGRAVETFPILVRLTFFERGGGQANIVDSYRYLGTV